MKTIIVGNGKVGFAIARQLAGEKHDIVVVDEAESALSKADATLDVLCMQGNGASISVLIAAGVRNADLVIAVTGRDETNLVCCLIAKKLGARHTVARIRNTDYRTDAPMLKKEVGLDMVINPDLVAAEEIARILNFPSAFSVEPFAGGRIDMIGFQITEQDKLSGMALGSCARLKAASVLVCAAQCGEELLIPDGSFVPQVGDKLYLIGAAEELLRFLGDMGRPLEKVRNVALLGGSRISMYLTWALEKTGNKVRILERNHEKCLHLAEELPKALIIEGDGTDSELLSTEDIFSCDAFVALTDRDEDNLLMALSAQHAGVKKVVAKMTRPNYMDLVLDTRIDSIISPKDIVSNQITRYVRALANSEGSAVESLHQMLGGSLEVLEFVVTEASPNLLHKTLRELTLKRGLLLAALARDQQIIIPDGNTELQEGDHVIVVASGNRMLNDLNDILS
jgi:trk system potassium uptake protein TrkA